MRKLNLVVLLAMPTLVLAEVSITNLGRPSQGGMMGHYITGFSRDGSTLVATDTLEYGYLWREGQWQAFTQGSTCLSDAQRTARRRP